MSVLQLLDFQQAAATKLLDSAVGYFVAGPDRVGGRQIPFVGQLKAVTGAGKTPILADVVGRLNPSIILWTTKYGSVVDQTATNLAIGGKYHHLLGNGTVEVLKFSEIHSAPQWQRILAVKDGLTILVSTVAAWNSTEKDERLNVHRVSPDWGDKSRWDQLRTERNRPLWIVYDEAHNTTTEQIELLDELEPAGFFVASASPITGRLNMYLSALPDELRQRRIAPIKTRSVVDAQLLKSTISLADYQSSPEEMVQEVVKRRADLQSLFTEMGESVIPKAIYVVETSNATAKGTDSRPVAIWKTLVNNAGIDPSAIAVCTNTKELPKGAIRIDRIEQLAPQFTHIIFNKKLQEGWDDPSVYVCYFDGRTDSINRIQQVLGRALRQPNARHLADEDLNTAYFFINCPNEALEKITDQLKEELRIYKGDDEPDDFEPFQIKQGRSLSAKIALKLQWIGQLKVPELQLELPPGGSLKKLIEGKTYTFADDELSAPGAALVNVVSVRTGETIQNVRNLLEDMRFRCGTYLQDQIRGLSKNCLNSIHPAVFSNSKLDKCACIKSKALQHYQDVAREVVVEFENRVRLEPLVDPASNIYLIGPYHPSGSVMKMFDSAAHPHYDTKAFNDPELKVAKALDKFQAYVWVRNKDRLGYGIPLPMKSGSSSQFFPDFLWWVKNTVWAIDPTGKFILEEKIRTKLLTVPPPLRIAFITPGKYDIAYRKLDDGGWTLSRHRVGNATPETFDDIDTLLGQVVTESD